MAGYSYQGRNQNSCFAAVYTFTGKEHTCEDEIRLTTISEEFFRDNGSAMAWALGL